MRNLVWALVLCIGCGRGSVTGPSEPVDNLTPTLTPVVLAVMPAHAYGAFTASEDVPEAAANGGNVVLVVPTFADDPNVVASALRANGKVAIVSAHHVFGNPRETWGVGVGSSGVHPGSVFKMHGVSASSVGGWQNTLTWMEPLRRAGVLAAVYVVDEPLHNGIAPEVRDEAISIVRKAGFPTVIAEWVQDAKRTPRAPSDYYGVTCYSWPGAGSWSMDRCETEYHAHPDWNLVIGQGYDLQYTPHFNGSPHDQVARWAKLGNEPGRAGIVFWVWRWPGQVGIADDSEVLSAYNHERGE